MGISNRAVSRLALLVFAGISVACSVAPVQVEDANSPSISPPQVIDRSAPRAPSSSKPIEKKAGAASDELLRQAYEQYDQAHWQRAVQLAERGLRIDRHNANWHFLLAKCYASLGDSARAREFASQGLTYAPSGNGPLREGLQTLLIDVKP